MVSQMVWSVWCVPSELMGEKINRRLSLPHVRHRVGSSEAERRASVCVQLVPPPPSQPQPSRRTRSYTPSHRVTDAELLAEIHNYHRQLSRLITDVSLLHVWTDSPVLLGHSWLRVLDDCFTLASPSRWNVCIVSRPAAATSNIHAVVNISMTSLIRIFTLYSPVRSHARSSVN